MTAMEQKPSKGDTRPAQQETEGGRVPRTPNEHDTSADSQKARQSGSNEVGKAAHEDATGIGPISIRFRPDRKLKQQSPALRGFVVFACLP